jgi:hypothetical protein
MLAFDDFGLAAIENENRRDGDLHRNSIPTPRLINEIVADKSLLSGDFDFKGFTGSMPTAH